VFAPVIRATFLVAMALEMPGGSKKHQEPGPVWPGLAVSFGTPTATRFSRSFGEMPGGPPKSIHVLNRVATIPTTHGGQLGNRLRACLQRHRTIVNVRKTRPLEHSLTKKGIRQRADQIAHPFVVRRGVAPPPRRCIISTALPNRRIRQWFSVDP
jgi:hypothetical protein